jgi:hypothetical protein
MALRSPAWIKAWNVLGALDLVNAVTLGLLSAPGVPFRVFTVGPGTSALGILPWVMVPAMLVPLYLIHSFCDPGKTEAATAVNAGGLDSASCSLDVQALGMRTPVVGRFGFHSFLSDRTSDLAITFTPSMRGSDFSDKSKCS